MLKSPSNLSCPGYSAATQVSPESIDENPTQPHESNAQPRTSPNQHHERDYYEQLFSSDSEDELEADIKDPKDTKVVVSGSHHPGSTNVNINRDFLSQERDFYANLFTPESDCSTLSQNNLSFSTHAPTFKFDFQPCNDSETIDTGDIKPHSSVSSPLNHDIDTQSKHMQDDMSVLSPPPKLELPISEMNRLLGFEQPLPKIISAEVSPSEHSDRIGTFNIQNKFEYTTAAELMVGENLAFLALQEPHGAQTTISESWQAFNKCELQSARIDCFETKYQVILVDTWKWGGKTISNIEMYLQGRIVSVAFGFGDGSQLGIISVYASSAEIHGHSKGEINDDMVGIYDDITSQWINSFPNINIIVIGDFQETCSTSNKDNLGTFRKEKDLNGILAHVEDTHESFIRSVNVKDQYLTRFGQAGARGIDHFMVSQNPKLRECFSNPRICRNEGHSYFASDHSLLMCEYERKDTNNNEDGQSVTKFNYAAVSKIKLQSSGENGQILEFNENQFKGSEKYKNQKHLYNKLQKLTNNSADITNSRLPELEHRVDKLFDDLWNTGITQKVSGKDNKLVDITEDHAVELAYSYEKFRTALKEVMDELELSSVKNNLETAGKNRGRLRQRVGFKTFRNLPIPTKLRYLRMRIRGKLNLISKAQWWIKEAKMKYLNSKERMNEEALWKIRDTLVQTQDLQKQADLIVKSIYSDTAERQAHMDAIKFETLRTGSTTEKSSDDEVGPAEKKHQANVLPIPIPNISASMTQLMNSWLMESGCSHGFVGKATPSGHESLSQDISAWKMPMTDFIDPPSVYDDDSLWETINTRLEECEHLLRQLSSKVTRIQIRFRKDTLHYLLYINSINAFTRKVLFKPRAAPATHSVIWDDNQNGYRPCKNEIEELKATQEFHSRWMSDSKSVENCAFASVITAGKLGARGIKLTPNRKVRMRDIDNLIHNGSKLPRRIKRAFLKAHKKYTAKLFRAPSKSRKEFNYPFFLTDARGTINMANTVERKLWKSLASIPAKARHDGAHIAVLGRFGERWRKLLVKFVKLMLVMRYIPAEMKKISRYPIPKPGKPNEYRPISLCDDLYCFLNGLITGITSQAIEKIKLLHEGITSYRRGKSCATLVAIEQCFREDCVEGNKPTVQIDEDEEKFFDRVCLDIILAVMKINGFPDSGFIEMKACMMSAKLVEIITAKGTAYAIFQCGLEQGNPDSPTIANLVIKLKHDIWRTLSKRAKKIFRSDADGNCDRYEFHTCDRDDVAILLYMIGYCDDNTKFITAANENNLVLLVQYYIQLAGDLSMTTKIGRKSSKCDVQFFNISAELAIKLEKCWSTAWSFIHDKPIEEQVPFKIFLQDSELSRFFKLINYDELNMEEQQKWTKLVQPKAHRHLGLHATLRGDTSLSSSKTIAKMHDRLTQLKIRHMDTPAQRKCTNMLINSMHSYVPIQSNYNQQELQRLDASVANVVQSRNGISNTDCKHRIFLPQKDGGLGILSALETDIVSVARELEILTNGEGLDSKTVRGRAAAILKYEDIFGEDIYNHVLQAIWKLGKYGIFFRDSRDEIINNILEKLARDKGHISVGNELYKGGNGAHLGLGKKCLLTYCFGGKLHNLLLHLQQCNWIPDAATYENSAKCGVSVESILLARKATGTQHFDQIDNAFSYFEWTNLTKPHISLTIQEDPSVWIHKRPSHSAKLKTKDKWEWNHKQVLQSSKRLHLIDWERYVISNMVDGKIERSINMHSTYGRILDFLLKRRSPLIIATDGSHRQNQTNQEVQQAPSTWNTSSAIALCSLDIRNNELLETREWMHRPMIPLLCRTAVSPTEIGSCDTDIAHGECFAVVMEELLLDKEIPRVVIMDSEAVRQQVRNIRDNCSEEIDRVYIREHAGGISKFFASILKESFCKMKEQKKLTDNKQWLVNTFQQRNETFLALAEQWITPKSSLEEDKLGWGEDYFDGNVNRAVLKINSHQLETCGTRIKTPSRYETLIPNLATLNANHYADVCADLAFRHVQSSNEMVKSASKLHLPNSNLTFFLTCNGKLLDRHVSVHIRENLTKERLKRISRKHTQGLLWRILQYTTSTWKTLSLNVGLFRSLLGMSNTHTRSLYKSAPYRMGCLLNHVEKIHDPAQKEAILNSTINNQVNLVSRCTWCNQKNIHNHKGNRRHMYLDCSNDNIVKFRIKMNNTIGDRFAIFIIEMQKHSSVTFTEKYIRKINADLKKLQKDQTGRLLLLPDHRNKSYLDIDELLRKLEVSTMATAISTFPQIFFSHILGLVPEHSIIEQTDDEIGVIDGPWLGLTPTCIDSTTKTCISKITMLKGDKDAATACKTELLQSWREVKALILGKAAGIHKVIKAASKREEATLIKKHKLEEMVEKSKVQRRKRQRIACRQSNQPYQPSPKKIKIQNPTKRCNGITCSREKVIWCYRNNFRDNMICLNKRQCQRCAIFTGAMNKTKNILQEMIEATSNNKLKWNKLIKLIKQTDNQARIQYPSLMNMLKTGIPTSTYFTRAQYIKKQRPTEAWKRICRVLIAVVNIISPTPKFTNSQEILQKSMHSITNLLTAKSIELNRDLAEIKKYITNIQSQSNTIQEEKSPVEYESQQRKVIEVSEAPVQHLQPRDIELQPFNDKTKITTIVIEDSESETDENP